MFEEPRYQLRIKIFDETVRPFYENFQQYHHGDSGIDLITKTEVVALSNQVVSLNMGIKCEMLDLKSNKFVSYILAPRSSISNTSFMMANSIGIIDAGYRGEIIAKVRNMSTDTAILSPKPYFQIISPNLKPIVVKIVDELTDTTRGAGGFGSTS